jgi:uracil-DNA glycosylase
MIANGADPQIAISNSFVAWWRDAGVDYCVDGEPFDWLAGPEEERAKAEIRPEPRQLPAQAPQRIAPIAAPSAPWPDSLTALHEAFAGGAPLPGCDYSAARALPVGAANAKWMILTDFPEEADIASGKLGEGPAGTLLRAMLSAIGIDLSSCYIAALAHSRPASGSLPQEAQDALARFAKHHIALANPQRILLLGSAATEFLLGKDLMAARADLPDFNHNVENRAAMMTFHPRTLLARPILKAQAWRDLQMLAKKELL